MQSTQNQYIDQSTMPMGINQNYTNVPQNPATYYLKNEVKQRGHTVK